MLELTLREIADAVQGTLERAGGDIVVRNYSTDSRNIAPSDVFWALEGENFDGHDYCLAAVEKGAVAVVIRSDRLPGVEIPSIRVADTLWALGELAKLLRDRMQARVVGITGSVGKTTTKEFTRSVLAQFGPTAATEGNLNNLIGVPKTISRVEKTHQWLVLEMGTDRPGEIRRLTEIGKPDVGVITSIGEAHLERLGGIEGVFLEKSSLLQGLSENGAAIIPQASAHRNQLLRSTRARTLTFGVENDADILAVDPRLTKRGCYGFTLETPNGKSKVQLQVPGIHQVEAAVAAAAVGVSQGLALEGIVQGLQMFAGLPGRCEVIELPRGVTLIADHYNANPVSMAAAVRLLETFLDRRRVMIVGEMWDLGEKSAEYHRQVGERIGSGSIDLLVGVGPKSKDLIASAIEAGLSREKTRWWESTDQACSEAGKDLLPGDVVLIKGSRGMRLEKLVQALDEGDGETQTTGGMPH